MNEKIARAGSLIVSITMDPFDSRNFLYRMSDYANDGNTDAYRG